MDNFLESLGYKFKFDELKPEEQITALTWYESLQKSELTLSQVKDYVNSMRESVEQQLADTPETETVFFFFQRPNRKAVLLKARLLNYLMLEGLLTSPEKAKRAIEREMKGR